MSRPRTRAAPRSAARPPPGELELWGGIECTVNRVGDRWHDQLRLGGHHDRLDDLDALAAVGLRTVRYPVLWERVAPDEPDRFDWAWSDTRMERLRALGVRPIVGLVHHGSGPAYTSLLDPAFPEKLARYAGAVAERYPWVTDWTPVNEPLTTARFAALYGFWYPHHRDERSFVQALLHQLRGVGAAMRAIRAVVPGARLVQTEDYGRTVATPRLRYQADYDNARRLLGFDLLYGQFGPGHPLWEPVRALGFAPEELAFPADAAPDVIGMNYYVTSDRLLDARLDRYPADLHGGNGRDRYVDIEAVRAWGPGILGHAAALHELWERYRRPLAITEAFLGCTREEQARWLLEAWHGARAARAAGVDVRAVTAWSLFGATDWDSLVTSVRGAYECGAFDARSEVPRPTVVVAVARALTRGETPTHPALAGPGWWRRPLRLLHAPVGGPAEAEAEPGGAPLLVIGARGTLGQAFARMCQLRGLTHRVVTRAELDVSQPDSIAAALDALAPWGVVNAAGYVRVDDAEREWWSCYRDNTLGAGFIAAACAQRGLPLVTFSSDLVFDGARRAPYVESDAVAPLSVYGFTKAQAEDHVARLHPGALVVRTSPLFGPWDPYNFVTRTLDALRHGPLRAAHDEVVSPTFVPDLVNAALDLLLDGEAGLWHLANPGAVSWADLGRAVAVRGGRDEARIIGVPGAEIGSARRPRFSALGSERGVLLPPLAEALDRYFESWRPVGAEEETCGYWSRAGPGTSGAS
jgi:dTDP-4-dehydrorhamnose reductase